MSASGTKQTFAQRRLKVRLPALNRRSGLNVGFSIAALVKAFQPHRVRDFSDWIDANRVVSTSDQGR
jgi:hypothetical protein